MGCTIFCRRADSGTFYTPRIELNDLGVSPYFPDGTWCHRENNMNYYCIQHHCLPEVTLFCYLNYVEWLKSNISIEFFQNFKLTKSSDVFDDLTFLQNARPSPIIPQDIKDYLSLGPDGKPIRTTLDENDVPPKDEEWENKDYVEISDLQRGKFSGNGNEDEFNYV